MSDAQVTSARSRVPTARILMLTERVPGHDTGFGVRITNVIEGLRAIGDLHVCLIDSSERGATLRPSELYRTSTVRAREIGRWAWLGDLVRLRPPRMRYRATRRLRREIVEAVGGSDWDLVVCCRCRVHLVSDGLFDAPRIVDFDDLNDALLESRIHDRTALRGRLRTFPRNVHDRVHVLLWRRLQRSIAGRVDRVGVCSQYDADKVAGDNVAVIPNGYPDPGTPAAPSTASGNRMLFVGPLTYEPNRLAVEWFVQHVLPAVRAAVSDAEFVVVGARDGATVRGADAPGVTLTGYVPDITPHYRSASIAVVPLHSGGGTRIKVIESLARRVPMVSTTFGCAGHDLTDGSEAILADSADDFAKACIELLGNPERRERLATAGRRLFEQHLTSSATSRAVGELAVAVLDPRFDRRAIAR
ncbi:MAG TPA: glycosyltransferase family 4 protein [Ilumatobacter sp.]|nr:glycosyltransferase family 4 protein [Ilumatobacter sp.]